MLLGQTVIPRRHAYGYGAITLSGQAFNPARLTRRFITRPGPVGDRTHRPATPHAQPPTGITRARFGLVRFRSPLLTEYPFLQVLRCFTSLRTPRKTAVTAHNGCRVTPFRNPRIKASSAAPRGISLPATSFIGPVCQGIHHTPLQATPHTGQPARPNEHRTTDHQHSAITKRSNNNQTPKTGDPVEIHQYKQTTTTTNGGMARSRPLSSSQTTTPHQGHNPNTRDHEPRRATRRQPPPKRGPWRPGNPTACPYPPPKERNDRSTPARPTPPQGQSPREPTPGKKENSVERR